MQVSAVATAGLTQAVRRFETAAERISRLGTESGEVDPVHEIVEQIDAKRAAQANQRAIWAADDARKRLLDIKV